MQKAEFNNKLSEILSGSINRVTFHSEESGFSVLRVKTKGQRDEITVTGHISSVTAGEMLQCQGQWVNNPAHGLQFKAEKMQTFSPCTTEGMEKYLGSGMIRGIGPHFAKKLIKAFGSEVLDVIENKPQRLMELEGIGKKRKNSISAAWQEQKTVRDIMLFLQSHGVGCARAVRIYKTYGEQAITKVQENPYRLALDIHGIGFKTADTLAENLGIAKDSIIRAEAGIRHSLHEHCSQGHCAATHESLLQAAQDLLNIPKKILKLAIENEINDKNIIADTLADKPCIYPADLFYAECNSAERLKTLLTGDPPWGQINTKSALPWVEKRTGLKLAESQTKALINILQSKISIITGGPGVGKTTIVHAVIQILLAKKQRVFCAAPTGRAAKRLGESTGMPAKTIHRLLDFDPQTFAFKHDADNPLEIDILVVDEASMLDIKLLNSLLKAIPTEAALLFIGDIDQLPSVGSGSVLADLINSKCIPTMRLQEIFRQAKNSAIVSNAHRINQGYMPEENNNNTDLDFYTIYTDNIESIPEKIINLISRRLPKHLNCDPINDIQILTPMNRGALGCQNLNSLLQRALNGRAQPVIKKFGQCYAPGDKVMQIRNNYDKEVFNGDIGRIKNINSETNSIDICFDKNIVTYSLQELDEIQLAYTISIHKSQGSEFPVIIIPIVMQHYMLLARNLLYTGITRGKKMVILIGEKKAVEIAVRNNQENKRSTKLSERLQ